MATTKVIRRRIASVKSTQQITRAMKLVAAARLRRSQASLINARPYHEALRRVADSLLASASDAAAPAENAAPAALVIIVTSDRGLCGGYNSNVIRFYEDQASRVSSSGLEPKLFDVGRKGSEHFKRIGQPLEGERINNLPRLATIELARAISDKVLHDYRSGAISEADIVYSRFHSPLSQPPTFERLLPIEASKKSDGETAEAPRKDGEAAGGTSTQTDYLIEPSAAELIPVVMRSYVEASIYHALLEAETSFFAAQMTAMDSATNNAADMISRLTLEMNRARQAQITKELMDIVGGAEALRG
ncbi:MAG TPA: ATP synthase F1 subunit gamma [Candidatus Binataceae bacterium]|nr:ATP synthase F1 subunit gamma [Candidatus Binataceae bacterium]